MTVADEWVERVSNLAKTDAAVVEEILDDEQIPRRRTLPARHRLRVGAVHFSGIKHPRIDGQRRSEPFAFTHVFSQKVTAFMTRHRNLAGKSAILDVVLWAVRGTTGMPNDVRSWLRQAAVEMRIDDERFIAIWAVNGGVPQGRIVQILDSAPTDWEAIHADGLRHAERENGSGQLSPTLDSNQPTWRVVALFEGDAAFKAAAADLIGARLGFERAEVFTRKPHGDKHDGRIVSQDWARWSQGLFISGKPIAATIGEDPMNSALLLQMYIGTAWGPAAIASKARLKAREADVASDRRRATADDSARNEAVEQLQAEEAQLTEALDALGEDVGLKTLDSFLAEAQAATAAVLDAEANVDSLARARLELIRDVDAARADEVAAREDSVTTRFWHTLKPSCCPRCDTVVGAAQWAREDSGNCSLCNSDLDAAPQPPVATAVATEEPDATTPGDDDHDAVQVAAERVTALEAEAAILDSELAAATKGRDDLVNARSALIANAPTDPDVSIRRAALTEQLAVLRGRLQERTRFVLADPDFAHAELVIRVLQAAGKEAKRRSDEERNEVLQRVSEDILDLARRLGFIELERTLLDGGTKLPVWKDGEDRVSFGSLREGEKLRLKIALLIALLRAGEQAGIGRHPGLLVIDSIGREEMNETDIRKILEELVRLAGEYDIQVLTSSAQGDRLVDGLPEGSVRLSRTADDFMW